MRYRGLSSTGQKIEKDETLNATYATVSDCREPRASCLPAAVATLKYPCTYLPLNSVDA
jgi:hypothetical protein